MLVESHDCQDKKNTILGWPDALRVNQSRGELSRDFQGARKASHTQLGFAFDYFLLRMCSMTLTPIVFAPGLAITSMGSRNTLMEAVRACEELVVHGNERGV